MAGLLGRVRWENVAVLALVAGALALTVLRACAEPAAREPRRPVRPRRPRRRARPSPPAAAPADATPTGAASAVPAKRPPARPPPAPTRPAHEPLPGPPVTRSRHARGSTPAAPDRAGAADPASWGAGRVRALGASRSVAARRPVKNVASIVGYSS